MAPSADYLRSLVSGLIADDSTPRAFRNECHQLMLAIHANDATQITGILARLRAKADETGRQLPDMETPAPESRGRRRRPPENERQNLERRL
jgi:hypothetical protein